MGRGEERRGEEEEGKRRGEERRRGGGGETQAEGGREGTWWWNDGRGPGMMEEPGNRSAWRSLGEDQGEGEGVRE